MSYLPGMDPTPSAPAGPALASYDAILVSTSGGKDSQAMLAHVVELATRAGVRERVIAVHCDLGRVEWQGTRALAARQAELLGVPFRVVRRAQGDLLDHVRRRGRWPDPARRYCTSDHKRAPVHVLLTALVREMGLPRQARILSCMGMRAQESPGRRKLAAFEKDARASNGKRHVDRWLPIHAWTVERVWERIRQSGLPHHEAYDLGMPRLSCVFCIYASRDALLLAGQHNRELLDAYVDVEQATGHDFKIERKVHLRLADIRDALDRGEQPTLPILTWGDM
jgi:3'-phosphoadenosine 5'-phosphosulfate sulfotransferase (PAPS reductase)/FAD synthetase